MFEFLAHLSEVGRPIRHEAAAIRAARIGLQQHAESEMCEIHRRERALDARIRELWSPEEIAAAEADGRAGREPRPLILQGGAQLDRQPAQPAGANVMDQVIVRVGADPQVPGVDGVRFACADQEVADAIEAADAASDAEYEHVVDALCDAGEARYLG